MKLLRAFFVLIATLATATYSGAAQYPEKPIRIIVGFAAGGPSDAAARAIAGPLAHALGQPVVVENKPGGNGVIAAEVVRNAPPDGYSLLWGQSAVLVGAPFTQTDPPYDPTTDFTPLSLVGQFALCIFSNRNVPAKTLREFVDYARAHPGTISYATDAITEDIVAALIEKVSGITMVRVPYKGGLSQMPDLLAGRVQLGFTSCAAGLPEVRAGGLRVPSDIASQA